MTRKGKAQACWRYENDMVRYELTTPVEAEVVLEGSSHHVKAGSYVFWIRDDRK